MHVGVSVFALVDGVRRRRGHSAALPALAGVAVAGDAVEGVALLQMLNRTRPGVYARRAQIAALIKFAVLAGMIGYVTIDRFRHVQ